MPSFHTFFLCFNNVDGVPQCWLLHLVYPAQVACDMEKMKQKLMSPLAPFSVSSLRKAGLDWFLDFCSPSTKNCRKYGKVPVPCLPIKQKPVKLFVLYVGIDPGGLQLLLLTSGIKFKVLLTLVSEGDKVSKANVEEQSPKLGQSINGTENRSRFIH